MRTRKFQNHLILTMLLALIGWCAVAQADNTRIEALDGGVVDLSGVTHIIGLGRGIDMVADGEGSIIKLPRLEVMLDDTAGLDSSLQASNQGLIELNAIQPTELGSHVVLHVTPTGSFSFNTLSLTPGSFLYGQGTLPGNIINAGLISPGESVNNIGRLIIAGDYTQSSLGRLAIEMQGNLPGTDFDQLNIVGNANLLGALDLNVFNDFVPYAGSNFEFISAAARTGEFTQSTGLTLPTGGQLSINYSATAALLHAAGIGFQDQTGPLLSNVQFNAEAFANASIIEQSGQFTVTVSDPSGVGRVEYALDGVVLGSARSATDQYALFWNPLTTSDGLHTLTLTAFDTLNNSSSLTFSFTVALVAPGAPVIIQPEEGLLTNQPTITVTGTAVAEASQVQLFNNGAATGSLLTVQTGSFSGPLALTEDNNLIQAKAYNRGGESISSNTVNVTLDSSQPDAPTGLTATAREAGEIVLSWSQVNNQNVVGYELYRALVSFTDIAQASKLNSSLLTEDRYDDLPSVDGTYFYRVVAVNSAGTRSDLSNVVEALSDSEQPRAESIVYNSTGMVDEVTGRMAAGQVSVVVSVNEDLLTSPFLSLTPANGVPISVALTKITETEYQGSFSLSDNTPSGTAYAVFSARDKAGNRGTDILAGATIEVDTDGPTVTLLLVTPEDPIQNDQNSPTNVTVSLVLDEAPKAGTIPVLEYILSAADRTIQIVTLTEQDPTHWDGSFNLPADAGLNEIETLSFSFQAQDDLDNLGSQINGLIRFQVYQGDLPPLDPPTGLIAIALPAGQVRLRWQSVEMSADYELYRQAPGETELTVLARSSQALEYIDNTSVDGLYQYAVASVRQINSQESVSGLSASVQIKADAADPLVPQGLELNLLSTGIEASWNAAVDDDVLSYRLYRSALAEIVDTDGLTAIVDEILLTTTVDSTPSADEHSYVVTAVDPAGNESLPSNSVYLNFDLLPVASLLVEQVDAEYPLISWTHQASDIAGYDFYLGAGANPLMLNNGLLTANSYEDTGYNNDERFYSVIAEDLNAARSLSRSILLPAVTLRITKGLTSKNIPRPFRG